ncbi:CBS domain-containing protein [Streptomyces virginiae]|uniref:CBS domain-containing protein n=1 Tax=Streptomyces virginiae TaxID=1961 RepID=UPI00371578A6
MSARDLATPYPSVTTDESANAAIRLLTEHSLPALLVVDGHGMPYAVVPVSQLVRQLVPEPALDDPLRAAVLRDEPSERLAATLEEQTVGDWLPRRGFGPRCVGPDATAAQIAAIMARRRIPLVPVVEQVDDNEARMLGVVSATAVMRYLITPSDSADRR